MRALGLSGVLAALTVLVASCAGAPRSAYGVKATLACLKKRPEYTSALVDLDREFRALYTRRARGVRFYIGTNESDPGSDELNLADGWILGAFVVSASGGEGRGDWVLLEFVPSESAARRLYAFELYASGHRPRNLAPDRFVERRRNVVVISSGERNGRQIVAGCLRTRR